MSAGDIFLGLIAVLFPPIAVWIKRGLCSCDSIINIALCILGYFPGLLHAWYIIFTYPEYDYDYEPIADEEARVTYVVVAPGPQGGRHYGTPGACQQPQQHKAARVPPNVSAHSRPVPQASVPTPPLPQQQQQYQQQGNSEGPSNGSNAPPPAYDDAIKGDHKIQTQE
ncbi:hypothetical protein DV736_g6431, partial [Chaetothyriales sp. CBS 134916]